MQLKTMRVGSVATNVLLPWLLLLLIVSCLIGYRYYQTQQFVAQEAYSDLHRKATLLASDLRFLAQERWSNALAYQATKDARLLQRLQQGEMETQLKLDELERLFVSKEKTNIYAAGDQDHGLLDSYRVIREGHVKLYELFLQTVDSGEHRTPG